MNMLFVHYTAHFNNMSCVKGTSTVLYMSLFFEMESVLESRLWSNLHNTVHIAADVIEDEKCGNREGHLHFAQYTSVQCCSGSRIMFDLIFLTSQGKETDFTCKS